VVRVTSLIWNRAWPPGIRKYISRESCMNIEHTFVKNEHRIKDSWHELGLLQNGICDQISKLIGIYPVWPSCYLHTTSTCATFYLRLDKILLSTNMLRRFAHMQ
jgi:hypothetical protein